MNHGPDEQGPRPEGQDLEGQAPHDAHEDGAHEDAREDGARANDAGEDDSRSADLNSADPGTDRAAADHAAADDPPMSLSASKGAGLNALALSGAGRKGAGLTSAGRTSTGLNGSAAKGIGGFDSDELMLRDLLHHAVSEIEPRDGTLEHLRRAVPARRTRKRQAVVGMAAAALLIGTAIPALMHVSNSNGSDVNTSIMGNGSNQEQTEGQSKGQTGGNGSSGGSSGGTKESGKSTDKHKGDKGKGESNGPTGGTQASPTAAASTLCTSAQLGGGGSVGAPDSGGAVYGSFRVSNISGTACTVTGGGAVSTIPQGAADASKITVMPHAAGDAAAGLPDPSLSLTQLVLEPGAAYEVRFAWVPSEPCQTTGGTTGGGTGGTDPTPDPTPTEQETPGTTTDGSNSVSTQLVMEDGVVDGSVLISHTTEGGIASFTTSVTNACAGVVYRTGLLAGA
ncbi:hypothetical protein [Streptomyces caniscabiei]|nr:hypothetical protein [Streptomyces caniscabiei]MDX3507531.1 hypothetical protein [Streptomyces caniscabiei]MDX3717493.1 hypothetical protein [Streptomyces caniscabiei]MDX3726820.1 hypothetical protein [Streptomyces caniscabiei]WEO25248.1 hypothetical protein IHE65_19835 [Streptomyces caniscabiei]